MRLFSQATLIRSLHTAARSAATKSEASTVKTAAQIMHIYAEHTKARASQVTSLTKTSAPGAKSSSSFGQHLFTCAFLGTYLLYFYLVNGPDTETVTVPSDYQAPRVVNDEDLIYSGRGTGDSGRNAPQKYRDTKTGIYFYRKDIGKKAGLVNELFFGNLAHIILEGAAPSVLMIKTPQPKDSSSSAVSFGSESQYKDSTNLEEMIKAAMCHTITGSSIDDRLLERIANTKNLGVSIALMCALGHGDRYAKNIVIGTTTDDPAAPHDHAAPIDWEIVWTGSKPTFLDPHHLKTKSAYRLAEDFLLHGALRELQKFYSPVERTLGMMTDGCDNQRMYVAPEIKEAIIKAVARDIESGAISEMYQRMGNLSDEDILDILQPITIIAPPGTDLYEIRLRHLTSIRDHCRSMLHEQHDETSSTMTRLSQ